MKAKYVLFALTMILSPLAIADGDMPANDCSAQSELNGLLDKSKDFTRNDAVQTSQDGTVGIGEGNTSSNNY